MAVPSQRLLRLEPWQDSKEIPYIEIEGLGKNYEGFPAVNNVNLSIYRGEFFSILGASGCGKTTLLRLLAGFETPTSGRIYIDGVDITRRPPYHRPVNMMFQSYALFPHMTVEQNVAFGLRQEGLHHHEIREQVAEILDLVQMGHLIHRKPHQLSGGQRQRVALARCLVKKPKVLLLDEPLAALDKKLREKTQFELVNIQERLGMTFIMVTHDQEEAMTMSTRIGVMEEGRLRQVGTPTEIYEFPNSRYVADFIGTINLFEGIVAEDEADYVLIRCEDAGCDLYIAYSASAPIGAQVVVGIRPEKILLTLNEPSQQTRNWVKGIVKEIAYLGDVSIYHVLLESGKVVMASLSNLDRLTERSPAWEDEVYLSWPPESGMVLST